MSEIENYIYQQFKNHFCTKSDYQIIIYGIGEQTKLLLEKIQSSTSNIVGLMDQQKTGEVLWGYKVLSYEEVSQLPNPIIIILARNSVVNIIYRRIEQFAKENQIPVFNIEGKRLDQNDFVLQHHSCFSLQKAELMEKIIQAKAISFDVFDTLITRKVLRPTDIFEIMQKKYNLPNDFAQIRHQLEVSIVDYQPTIEQIYQLIQQHYHLTAKQAAQWLNCEIEVEKQYLIRRETMCQILNECISLGKDVYLISDMYLPKNILSDILHALSIDSYKDLLVSCDYNKKKATGLFDEYLLANNLLPSDCLHIGDDFYADIQAAKHLEIDSYQIYKPIEMLEYSCYSFLLEKAKSLEEKIVLANFAVNAYNNPFDKYGQYGKLYIRNTQELVQLILAPIIFKYNLWLIQTSIQKNLSQIIFPSRDGYLLKQIYEESQRIFNQLTIPKAHYFYTSRRSAMIAATKNKIDFNRIFDFPDDRPFHEMIAARFGVVFDEETNRENLTFCEYQQLLVACQKERQNYLKYAESFAAILQQSVGLVDLVAMGSVQYSLERLLSTKFEGLYFLKRKPTVDYLNNLQISSMCVSQSDYLTNVNIYNYYYFLENIITSFEPTVLNFDNQGQPVFAMENRSQQQLQVLKECHDEIRNYCLTMNQLCWQPLEWQAEITIYDLLLGLFSKEYTIIENLDVLSIENLDEFMGKIICEVNR